MTQQLIDSMDVIPKVLELLRLPDQDITCLTVVLRVGQPAHVIVEKVCSGEPEQTECDVCRGSGIVRCATFETDLWCRECQGTGRKLKC